MYGYVQIYRPDLRFREYDIYRSHYCGLCHTLQKRCNLVSRLTLSYDFTFLSLLLDALYEPAGTNCQRRCLHGIGKKEWVYHSPIMDYTADMHLFFSYLHCLDDWQDNRKISRAALAHLLQKAYRHICEQYPQKSQSILQNMQQLKDYELQKETNPLLPAACFGRALGEGFCIHNDIWATELYHIGYYLGTFIYIMDAYDDLIKDRKHHNYNPFWNATETELAFHQMVKQFLQHAATEAAAAFERLPILQNADLLRNILYAGIWQPFFRKQKDYQTAVPNDFDQQKQENDHVKSL